MPISVDQESKEFHLYNDSLSYIIKVLYTGSVEQVYCACRLRRIGRTLFYRRQLQAGFFILTKIPRALSIRPSEQAITGRLLLFSNSRTVPP